MSMLSHSTIKVIKQQQQQKIKKKKKQHENKEQFHDTYESCYIMIKQSLSLITIVLCQLDYYQILYTFQEAMKSTCLRIAMPCVLHVHVS